MTKILDFSNGQNATPVLIVNPNFTLANRNVSIEFKEGLIPTFKVFVGCQTTNVTSENIDRILYELSGQDLPVILTEVIVKIGQNAKTSSPKLIEVAGNWLISKDKKAFDINQYEVKEINIKDKRKYFLVNTRAWDNEKNPMYFRGGFQLSKSDVDNAQMILQKIKDFFNEEK